MLMPPALMSEFLINQVKIKSKPETDGGNLDRTGFLSLYKESRGFEPLHRFKGGSTDFESVALPLCQLSKAHVLFCLKNGICQEKKCLPNEGTHFYVSQMRSGSLVSSVLSIARSMSLMISSSVGLMIPEDIREAIPDTVIHVLSCNNAICSSVR